MTPDPYPTAEQVRASQQPRPRAAAKRYAAAVTTLARFNADFLAMKEAGVKDAVLLEFLGEREGARKALAEAKQGLINAGWADGTLTRAERLGDAVERLLLGAAVPPPLIC